MVWISGSGGEEEVDSHYSSLQGGIFGSNEWLYDIWLLWVVYGTPMLLTQCKMKEGTQIAREGVVRGSIDTLINETC